MPCCHLQLIFSFLRFYSLKAPAEAKFYHAFLSLSLPLSLSLTLSLSLSLSLSLPLSLARVHVPRMCDGHFEPLRLHVVVIVVDLGIQQELQAGLDAESRAFNVLRKFLKQIQK